MTDKEFEEYKQRMAKYQKELDVNLLLISIFGFITILCAVILAIIK